MREHLVAIAELLGPDKVKLFQSLRLSGRIHGDEGKPVMELSDIKCLCSLAFMVDITKNFSALNLQLQDLNQLLDSLLSNVKSFEKKLKLLRMHCAFSNSTGTKPGYDIRICCYECAKLLQAFGKKTRKANKRN